MNRVIFLMALFGTLLILGACSGKMSLDPKEMAKDQAYNSCVEEGSKSCEGDGKQACVEAAKAACKVSRDKM